MILTISLLTGCIRQEEPSVDLNQSYYEIISGEIIQIFTEETKEGLKESLELDVKEEKTALFTLTDQTEYLKYNARTEETVSISKKEISKGNWVEIDCESYHDSDHHLALSIEVMENTVTKVGRGVLQQAHEVSEEEANQIIKIIEEKEWVSENIQCEFDYALNIKGRLIYYHSECGTLTTYDLKDLSYLSSQEKEIDSLSTKLNKEEKKTIEKLMEEELEEDR